MLLIKYYSREQIKANEMGWRVARMVDRRGAHTFLVGRPEGKSHLEDLDVVRRLRLKWIRKELCMDRHS